MQRAGRLAVLPLGQRCFHSLLTQANCLLQMLDDEDSKHKFEQFFRDSFIQASSFVAGHHLTLNCGCQNNIYLKWCPSPGCEFAVEYPAGLLCCPSIDFNNVLCLSGGVRTVECACGFRFCFSCRKPDHAPADCQVIAFIHFCLHSACFGQIVKKWEEKNVLDGANAQ